MDLLSELLAGAQFGLQEPHVHTFDGAWAFDLPTGSPLLLFVRHGRCSLWPARERNSFSVSDGHLLVVWGERECSLQSFGPRRDAATPFPWDAGVRLNRPVVLPGSESGVQLLSARVEWVQRPVSPSLPSILLVGPRQLALWPGRTTLHDALAEELLASRQGTEVLVRRLLEAMVIRALRTEISAGFWSVHGWLGALTDPVLRTGLGEAGEEASLRSVKSLADASRRSVRRLSAGLKELSGKRPRKLLAQLRIQRAVQQLEQPVPDLSAVARDNGYADVSTFCRAFRREMGCPPAEYWRRRYCRPFPRRERPDRAARPLSGRGCGPRSRPRPASAPRRSG